ncbi:DNA/RNA helicase domain-containing protein [Weissella cibaria]
MQNALNVLMKRGVHGLYLYAVDDELRNKLLHIY